MARPHRRTVIRTLAAGLGAAALVGCDDDASGEPAEPRVAVIGGGMAGVAAAWLLDPEVPVDLFEARAAIGGNVRTVEFDVRGQAARVDLGAQYFHPRVYPTYSRLLERYGILDLDDPTAGGVFVAPGTVTMTQAGEVDPFFVSPSIPDRVWPLTEPWNQPAVSAFSALATAARKLESEDVDWILSVGEWLPSIPVDEALRQSVILPWIAGINTGRLDDIVDFSARAATIFLSRALGDGPLESVFYYTLNAGMGDVLDRLVGECEQLTVRTEAPAVGLRRGKAGFEIATAGASHGPYSAVVLALPGPQAAALLDGLTGVDPVVAALNEIRTYEAKLALHRDPIYTPAEPRMRSLLNAIRTDTTCEVSMSMAEALPLLPDGGPVDLWKSWITARDEPPADVLSTETYTHILADAPTIRAQARLAGLQGAGGLYFAGGWMQPFDAQETALTSAINAVRALVPDAKRLAELSS